MQLGVDVKTIGQLMAMGRDRRRRGISLRALPHRHCRDKAHRKRSATHPHTPLPEGDAHGLVIGPIGYQVLTERSSAHQRCLPETDTMLV